MPRLLLIAFDGLDPELIQSYPNFAVYRKDTRPLRSVPSTLTQEAWAALYTGMSPSELGIVALPRDPDRVSTLKGIRAQTMFEVLAQEGRSVGVIGMPMTFPVKPLQHFMVAGFPVTAPPYRADDDYFFPPEIKSIIDGLYEPYLWANREQLPPKEAVTYEDIDLSIKAESRKIEVVQRILEYLSHPPLDLLAIGFQFTDIAAHCRAVYPLEKTYAAADALLGLIQETFDFDNLIILSDHGVAMTPWRGDPFPGYGGLGHRLYGTLICAGNAAERTLNKVLAARPKRSVAWRGLLRKAKQSWRWRRYRGILTPDRIVDITEVYGVVMQTLGVDHRPRTLDDLQAYTAEEEQSILRQLEWLGYL